MSLTPLEKDEQAKCDSLALVCGGDVVSFSQPRSTMQTEGIPDRRYRVFGVSFWWEVKSQAPDARLTQKQAAFLLAELESGNAAGCGTLEDFRTYLPEVRRGNGHAAGRDLLARWTRRGFRRESPKKKKAVRW